MPRFDDSLVDVGLYVPGVYAALLDRERERNARSDQLAAYMQARDGCHFRRGRGLADRLDAGESVVLRRVSVEQAFWHRDRPAGRVKLPLDRDVRHVEITADDRVAAVADPED